MLKTAFAVLALLAAAPACAQPPAPAPAAEAPLTIDSTLRELVLNPKTRAVIEKHMPGFPDRIESDQQLAFMFAGLSLSDLQHDPHVKGVTPAALTKIGAELADAQKPG